MSARTLEEIAAEMVSVIRATAPLCLLEDVARFLDEVDEDRGVTDQSEMQDDLRRWAREIREVLA